MNRRPTQWWSATLPTRCHYHITGLSIFLAGYSYQTGHPTFSLSFSLSLPLVLAPSACTLSRIYLPQALIFYHVIMSLFPTTSVSWLTLARLPSNRNGRETSFARNPTTNTGSWMNRSCRGRAELQCHLNARYRPVFLSFPTDNEMGGPCFAKWLCFRRDTCVFFFF